MTVLVYIPKSWYQANALMGAGFICVSRQQRSPHFIPASDAKPWPSAAAAALMVKPSRLDCRSLDLCKNEASTLSGSRHAASAALLCLVPKDVSCTDGSAGARILPEQLGTMMEDMTAPARPHTDQGPAVDTLPHSLLGACAMIGRLAAQRVTPLFESAVAVIAPCALDRVPVRHDSWTSTPRCRLY